MKTKTYTTSDIRFNGRNGDEWCGAGDVAELEKKLAAAEKTIHTLAEQMISDAEYTAKLIDKSLDASTMTSGKMAMKAIEELKKGE